MKLSISSRILIALLITAFLPVITVIAINRHDSPIEELQRQAGLIAAVSSLVTVAIYTLLVRSIARPLRRLAEAANAIEQEEEDFDEAQLQELVWGNDNIARLAQVLHDIAATQRQRSDELEALYAASQGISRATGLGETVHTVLDQVRSAIMCDAAEIALFDPEDNKLAVVAWSGGATFNDTSGERYAPGEGAAGFIARQHQSVLAPNLAEFPALADHLDDPAVRSLLGIPLLVGDRSVGTITLLSRRLNSFTESDRRLLETIGLQVAPALDRAQQMKQWERQLENQIERERMSAVRKEVVAEHEQVLGERLAVLEELTTPIIPIVEGIIVLPLIGSIDPHRAREITRTLLNGLDVYRAKVVILDITGVNLIDSGVANYLDKAIRAADIKGARTIITGASNTVAEAVVDLGIDWRDIETLRDLQTGLLAALESLGMALVRK